MTTVAENWRVALEQIAKGASHPESLARSALGETARLGPLPVDSFKDAAPHLRRPFAASAIRFKVQTVWPKNDPKTALVVAYIDARLVAERLNTVCPHLWEREYESITADVLMCHLKIDGITRPDVGTGYGHVPKGRYSDAFKRAAVPFGVGVSLYAMPRIELIVGADQVEQRDLPKGGKTLTMRPKGLARCRELYEDWLVLKGHAAFGPVLDHGDAEDAMGDIEVEADGEAEQGELLDQLPPDRVEDVIAAFAEAKMTLADIQTAFGAAGITNRPERKADTRAALQLVSEEQADALIEDAKANGRKKKR